MAAVACERENPQEQTSLQTPELEAADVTETSFTVRWSPVEGADSYDWELNAGAEQGSTTQTELQFSAMETGTYKVRVKAVSSERGIESAWAEINPEDKEAPYYFEPVTQSIFEQAEDAETLFRDILNARITTSSSLADAFEKYARTGDANVNYDISAYPEPVYYVLIAGIDEQMNTTTPVHYVEVPIEVTTSDNEFTVSVTDLQLTSITVPPKSTMVLSSSSSLSQPCLQAMTAVKGRAFFSAPRRYPLAVASISCPAALRTPISPTIICLLTSKRAASFEALTGMALSASRDKICSLRSFVSIISSVYIRVDYITEHED